jgi:uncharacterized membrane protein YukC
MDLRKRKLIQKEGRLIPRRKYPRPFRFVGIGVIMMIVIIIILYMVMVDKGKFLKLLGIF